VLNTVFDILDVLLFIKSSVYVKEMFLNLSFIFDSMVFKKNIGCLKSKSYNFL
jgi:hypothetical protein